MKAGRNGGGVMFIDDSLAGTGRKYLVTDSGRVRVSLKPRAGEWKVHLPIEMVKIEKNRIVFTLNESDVKDTIDVFKTALASNEE